MKSIFFSSRTSSRRSSAVLRAVDKDLDGAAKGLGAFFAKPSPETSIEAAANLEGVQKRLRAAMASGGDSLGPSATLALERLGSAFGSLRWAIKEVVFWRLPQDKSHGRTSLLIGESIQRLRRALAAASADRRETLLLEARRSARSLIRLLREGQERLWKGDAPFVQGLQRGEILRLLLEAAAAFDEALEGFLLESEGLR